MYSTIDSSSPTGFSFDEISKKIDVFYLSSAYGWPQWACTALYILILITIVLFALEMTLNSIIKGRAQQIEEHTGNVMTSDQRSKLRWFQCKYLCAYLLIMLADWLQGTNMYTLYSSYGVNVGLLFQTGFLSSAIFGTFIGVYVDRWGRRLGCIVFCLLEIVINTFEHFNNLPLLLVGRILGGISTSLLFSAFESWMVSEHRREGFPEDALGQTFSFASSGNGVVAILAGLLAQRSADISGDIGPFQLAIALTILVLILCCFWRENYGTSHRESEVTNAAQSALSDFKVALNEVYRQPAMICIGLSQALFEGAVYSFVFMWVPSLMTVVGSEGVPTGLVFSCFMLAMTAGGVLTSILLSVASWSSETISIFAYFVSALCVAVPVISFEFAPVFIAFLLLEAMVGVFNSVGGKLRSEYYPEGLSSSIISIFRLPLNLLVFYGTSLANGAGNDKKKLAKVYEVLVVMFGISISFMVALELGLVAKVKAKRD